MCIFAEYLFYLFYLKVVIANILETRKQEVVIVTRDSDDAIRLSDEEMESGTEIEQRIVQRLKEMHEQFCSTK